MSSSDERLVSAVTALRSLKRDSDLDSVSRSGQFAALVALCGELFAKDLNRSELPVPEYLRWALTNLFRATGLPSTDGASPQIIADAITKAMQAQQAERVHLCPLDRADDLPQFGFGPCEIRHFDARSFAELIQVPRLQRRYPSLRLDAEAFASFDWLVVRETVALPATIGERIEPLLSINLGEDFGAIKPYATAWPPAVEQAISALLLLPWEDWSAHPQVDWRAFRVPWVYSVDADVFASPKQPPAPDSLSWEPEIFTDPASGEIIESERPFRVPLTIDLNDDLAPVCEANWYGIQRALASPIFNSLVVHFFVKAFASDDIDEFLAHVIAIEAALGLESDYRGQPRGTGRRLSATERLCQRAAAITQDGAVADQFRDLFNLRSAFLHGRPVGTIPSQTRNQARILSRRVVAALVEATATSAALDRSSFLTSLSP